MLAADKLLLESRIARGAVQLKWKEFGLHHLNLTTVGTQAAVMAGFSITALIEFAPSPDANRALLFLFWTSNMVSLYGPTSHGNWSPIWFACWMREESVQ